jgi:Xaa-Pro aminopeptidase
MSSPTHDEIRDRVKRVRDLMVQERLDAIVVRSTDRFLNEYVPDEDSTRRWISGFTGSMGDVVIARDRAWACVDGRYWLQAERELEPSIFTVERVPLGQSIDESVHRVLKTLPRTARVGYEPERNSITEVQALGRALEGRELVPTSPSLVERVRGGAPSAGKPVRAVDEARAGRTMAEKLALLREPLAQARADWLVVTKLDEIAWLTNLRGDDFPYQATFRGLALASAEQVVLACPEGKVPADVIAARGGKLRVVAESGWVDAIPRPSRVAFDQGATPEAVSRALERASVEAVNVASPIAPLKAKKTGPELEAMLEAFARADDVVEKAARWLCREVESGKRVTEADFADKVTKLFEKSGATGLSFKVISAAGKNGAVIHYSSPDPGRAIAPGELVLLDTGAYYAEGFATDLTRTFLAGGPKRKASDEQRRMFTLVLKAAIAGMSARIPAGARGDQLDALVRAPLWKAGLSYNHGTGHGVGINVHEFPPRIGPQGRAPLEAGQVFSIEPGVYLDAFGGVRIENLCTLVEAKDAPGYLDVVPLTFSPLDARLVDTKLLTREESAWLRGYKEKGRARKPKKPAKPAPADAAPAPEPAS